MASPDKHGWYRVSVTTDDGPTEFSTRRPLPSHKVLDKPASDTYGAALPAKHDALKSRANTTKAPEAAKAKEATK